MTTSLAVMGTDWPGATYELFSDCHPQGAGLLRKIVEAPALKIQLPQQEEISSESPAAAVHAGRCSDAADVLRDPRRMLASCATRSTSIFRKAMAHLAPGPRPTDGVWPNTGMRKVEKIDRLSVVITEGE